MTLPCISYELMRRRILGLHILETEFTSIKYKKGLEVASQSFRISIIHKLYKRSHPIAYRARRFSSFIEDLTIQINETANMYKDILNNYMDVMYELS